VPELPPLPSSVGAEVAPGLPLDETGTTVLLVRAVTIVLPSVTVVNVVMISCVLLDGACVIVDVMGIKDPFEFVTDVMTIMDEGIDDDGDGVGDGDGDGDDDGGGIVVTEVSLSLSLVDGVDVDVMVVTVTDSIDLEVVACSEDD